MGLGAPIVVSIQNFASSALGVPYPHTITNIPNSSVGPPLAVGIESFNSNVLGTPFTHSVSIVPGESLGAPIGVGIQEFNANVLGTPFTHSVTIIGNIIGAPIALGLESFNSNVLGTPFSHEIDVTPINNAKGLRSGWAQGQGGSYIDLQESDVVILAQIGRNSADIASLYGRFDFVTTELDLGTGSAVTSINIGRFNNTLLDGTLNATGEFSIISDILLINKFGDGVNHSVFAIERGSTGADAVIHWNESANRFELGLFDTQAGTVVPTTTLSNFSNLRLNNLYIGGSGITPDGALSLTTTGGASDLTLGARSNTVTLNQSGSTALTGFTATSIYGAINEIAGASFTNEITNNTNNYSSGEIDDLEVGQIVYISSTNTVRLATASEAILDSNTPDPSKFSGVVAQNPVSGNATIKVISDGTAILKLEPSLSISAGEELYLSADIPGSATNIVPTGSGNVRQSIGFVKNTSTYDGSANLKVIAHISKGSRLALA